MPHATLPELSADQPLIIDGEAGYMKRRLTPLGYGRDSNSAKRRDLVICIDAGLNSLGLLLAVDAAAFNNRTISHKSLLGVQWAHRPHYGRLPLGVYRHYKDHRYQAISYGTDLTDPTRLVVVYIGLELDEANPGGRFSIRNVDDWNAEVDGTPRFADEGPTWEGQPAVLPISCDGCGQPVAPGEHFMDMQVALRTVFGLPQLDELDIKPTTMRVIVHNPSCFASWSRRNDIIQNVFNH